MATVSPYMMEQPPTSPGRALLSRAFAHHCALEWGYSEEDVAAVFERSRRSLPAEFLRATRLFGELMARGDIRTWARPFGGGEPIVLRTTFWELDDFVARFASSALNLTHPFDSDAEATHWIFVDLEGWNRITDELLAIGPGKSVTTAPPVTGAKNDATGRIEGRSSKPEEEADRLIRLPEIVRRTGMSKATIYRRMGAGRFPGNLSLDGNIVVWREREVEDWMAKGR
jgi:predicted DNA-binding transcriptional regulator AlpA